MISTSSIETYSIAERGTEISPLSASVLRVLLYYDIFNYPLTAEEILRHCGQRNCNASSLKQALDELVLVELIFRKKNYYLLRDSKEMVTRRIKGEQQAAKALKIASRKSRIIASFPFVRSVSVSGSLSKNYFDEESDIDFFLITEPGRLWLCRSLLVLYKKIFLFNSKKHFCVNYFIDTNSLQIADHNIFTATEMITLLPMYNEELFKKFFDDNSWVKKFYPNSSPKRKIHFGFARKNTIKHIAEKLLSGKVGEWLDQFFFKITLNHWRKKFPDFREEEFDVNLRSRKNVSKHHPRGFQFKVLNAYEEKCVWFEAQHQVSLH